MRVSAKTAIICLLALLLAMPLTSQAATENSMRITATYVVSPMPEPACNGVRVTGSGPAMIRVYGWQPGSFKGKYSERDCGDVLATPGAITLREGTMQVATNRGIIRATYEGQSGPPDSRLDLHFKGTFTVTGGTGRFAGTRGGGIFIADSNMLSGDTRTIFQGTLRVP